MGRTLRILGSKLRVRIIEMSIMLSNFVFFVGVRRWRINLFSCNVFCDQSSALDNLSNTPTTGRSDLVLIATHDRSRLHLSGPASHPRHLSSPSKRVINNHVLNINRVTNSNSKFFTPGPRILTMITTVWDQRQCPCNCAPRTRGCRMTHVPNFA